MEAKMKNIINLRHKKRDLYVELLRKGPDKLSKTEKQLISSLSLDDDIVLLLSNGMIFDVLENE